MGSERYSFYRLIKPVWGRETYLYALDKKPFREVYIQFRAGFSELYCHKLRYSRDNQDNMFLCPSCREEFECEFHLLYGCPVYEDIRQKYVSNVCYFSSVERLFSADDPMLIRSIAMYLYHTLKRRREAAEVVIADE